MLFQSFPGFGIDGDIRMIVQNYPYAQEFFEDAQNFEDLQNISKQVLSLLILRILKALFYFLENS